MNPNAGAQTAQKAATTAECSGEDGGRSGFGAPDDANLPGERGGDGDRCFALSGRRAVAVRAAWRMRQRRGRRPHADRRSGAHRGRRHHAQAF